MCCMIYMCVDIVLERARHEHRSIKGAPASGKHSRTQFSAVGINRALRGRELLQQYPYEVKMARLGTCHAMERRPVG